MTSIEEIFHEEDADMSVAMLTKVNNKYCFVIQPVKRWGKTDFGQDIMYFGGIGGKIEFGEHLIDALHREAKEEIGCDFSLIENTQSEIPIITKENITFSEIAPSTSNPLPTFIFQNKRTEIGRKSKTNVFVYSTKLINEKAITPIDNPAIILIPEQTLYEMEDGMSLSEARSKGVEIISEMNLPQNGILKPTPTPIALIKLHKHNNK